MRPNLPAHPCLKISIRPVVRQQAFPPLDLDSIRESVLREAYRTLEADPAGLADPNQQIPAAGPPPGEAGCLTTLSRMFSQVSDQISTLLEQMSRVEEQLGRMASTAVGLEKKSRLPEQEWFSIKEVAALTGLSEDHVRRNVTSGRLPAAHQGTFDKPHYRIHRPDIDEWMVKRRETPPARGKKKVGSGSYAARHHAKG